MLRIKKNFPNMNKKQSIAKLYDVFLKYNLDYVIIHSGDLLFCGVIYKNDLCENIDAKVVEDLSEKYEKYEALAETGDMDTLKESAKQFFRNDKKLLVVPVIDDHGRVIYCFEKELYDRQKEENSFYYKYLISMQYGYSIGKWLRERQIRDVNLIGAPEFIVPLYNDLKKNRINIKHIIDHQHFVLGG